VSRSENLSLFDSVKLRRETAGTAVALMRFAMTIRIRAMKTLAALCAGVAVLAQAAPTGPTMIHYSVDETLTATAVDPDATGSVQAIVTHDGKTVRQRLRVSVAQLDPRSRYTLLAQMGDAPNLVSVTNFTTTPCGRGGVLYVQNRVLNSRAVSRPTKRSLPEVINPVTHARTIAVANTNGEIVLTASLHESPSMTFEMAQVLENTGNDPLAVGCLAVACQNGGVQFRLFATGQSSEFTFCVNETPVATYPADETGRISVGVFPKASPSPFTFQKLSLRNASSDVVLEGIVP
jgi:hypothetical protein